MPWGLNKKTYLKERDYQDSNTSILKKNGNPTLETLLLIAEGLNCELKLIPKNQSSAPPPNDDVPQNDISQDPWQGVLD